MTLICALYNKLNYKDTILEFNEMFVNFEENEHWIPKKFERLMKKKRTRDFLQQEFAKNNFDVIKKTEDQCLEVKKISNSARILFTILIQCKWVQIEVLCILAVIMTQEFNQAYIETSTALNNDYFLDIFFNHGAVTLKSDPNQQNVDSIVSQMETDSCHQIKGSTYNQQLHQHSKPIHAQINREENKAAEKIDIQEILHTDILTQENEQFYKRSIEEVLKDVVHDFSSEESDLNEEPQKKIIKKKKQVSTPQQEPLVPNNQANYDHANDSTFSKSFETIHDEEFIMEEQEEEESLPSLIDEEENLSEENEKGDQHLEKNKTIIPASSTTSAFNSFSTVSQEDSTNDIKEDLLLTTDYKDNTLQFYATEKVIIAPYSAQIMILDIINAPGFTPTFPEEIQ